MSYKLTIMKYTPFKSLILPVLLLISLSSFEQNSNKEKFNNTKIKPIKQTTSESNSTEQRTVNKRASKTLIIGQRRKVFSTYEKIEAVESHIRAIDTKVIYINSDHNLRKKAIQENWFDEMKATREELVIELNELKSE